MQAADLRAAGQVEPALGMIQAARAAAPGNPRSHFAAGQLLAELRRWPEAEQAYAAAAAAEPDMAQRARCWLGIGGAP